MLACVVQTLVFGRASYEIGAIATAAQAGSSRAAIIGSFGRSSAVAAGSASRCSNQIAAQRSKRKVSSKPEQDPPPAEFPMPFRVGETLELPRRLGDLSERRLAAIECAGAPQPFRLADWHFRASSHPGFRCAHLFAIDDQFDSYTDATTLESHQYEMYLNEMGARRTKCFTLSRSGKRIAATSRR